MSIRVSKADKTSCMQRSIGACESDKGFEIDEY